MRRSLALGMTGLMMWFATGAAAAHAAESESSATVRITITIPPYAAGLAAQAEGAVGLWTMTDPQSAVMLKMPDALREGETVGDAAIFTPASMPLRIAASDPDVLVTEQRSMSNNGLVRRGFALRLNHAGSAGDAPVTAATLVIAGV